jgi:hypothetical protein
MVIEDSPDEPRDKARMSAVPASGMAKPRGSVAE